MKDEIQKILEMVKEGKITEEQGTALIEELAAIERENQEPVVHKPWTFKSLAEQFGKFSNEVEGLYASDLKENNFSMSRIQIPKGERFQFKNNTIRMSSVDHVFLEDAEFSQNTISKSNLHSVKVQRGSFQNSSLSASNLQHCEIADGEIDSTEISSSHLKKMEILSSHVSSSNFAAASVKSLSIREGSNLSGCSFEGTECQHLDISSSKINGMEIQASKVKHVTIVNTHANQLILRLARLEKTSFENCNLNDVLITSNEGWRKTGFDSVRFENVKLNKALFGECDWRRVTIKNVDMQEIRIMNKHLHDVTIDGNAAFREICGIESTSVANVIQ